MNNPKKHSKLIKIPLYVFIIFWGDLIYSQSSKDFYAVLNSDINSDIKIQKADSLLKVFEEQKFDSIPYLQINYAAWVYSLDLNKAILNAEKANHKKNFQNDLRIKQLTAFYLGRYCYIGEKYNKSEKAYQKVLKINNNNSISISAYKNLGDIYFEIDNYYKAYEFYKITASLLSKANNNLALLRNTYANLSSLSYRIKTENYLIEGAKYGKLADSLSSITETSYDDLFKIKFFQARTYNEEENLNINKARDFYNDALQIAKKNNDSIKIRNTYLGLGDLLNIHDKNESIAYYQKALALTDEEDIIYVSDIYYGLGHTYSIWKEYEKSLKYRHQAIHILTKKEFKKPKTFTRDFLNNFEHKLQLFLNLEELAKTYLSYFIEEKKDTMLLDKAIAYFKMCDILIDVLKTNSAGFKSRLYWRELSTDIYGKAIKACYLNDNIEDAFYFMEKNKALLLLEDIYNKNFKRKSQLQLPEKISKKYDVLKKEIALTNSLLADENKWSKIELDSLKKQRIDLDIELSVLEDENNITYETLNLETSISTLKDVQENLKNDEIAIEYHISIDDGYGILTNKDNGYALFITKDDVQLFEINNLDQLKSEVYSLTDIFKSPFNTQDDINEFNNLSNTIYNKLFPSDEIKQRIKGKTLTIAPDSYLSLLPFEALSVNPDSTSYLIRDAEIHYIYSNSFLKNIKRPTISNSKSLVIAPVNFNNNLTTLTNSLSEVNTIQHYYSGSTLLKEQASKTNFLEALNTSSNGVIHIASHANAQDKAAPWIAFHDENITLEELYLTQNDASLVVLSGCNTSVGAQEIGEGVMSLARGFFYSGSQSVISSLWSIDDKSTSKIVNSFYKNLSKGQTKSKALHNAKIEYLNTHNLSEISPHFWASLILLGQNDIFKPSPSYWIIYLSGFLLLTLALFFFIKSKRKNHIN